MRYRRGRTNFIQMQSFCVHRHVCRAKKMSNNAQPGERNGEADKDASSSGCSLGSACAVSSWQVVAVGGWMGPGERGHQWQQEIVARWTSGVPTRAKMSSNMREYWVADMTRHVLWLGEGGGGVRGIANEAQDVPCEVPC